MAAFGGDGDTIAARPPETSELTGMEWTPLFRQSMYFLGLQHGFRLATEPGTRSGIKGGLFHGYARSVSNLRGWADGDPLYVNYIGHPLQGSVTGNIFRQNDRGFRSLEFDHRDRSYWKGVVRSMAFSWVYSTQFEIGPLSEASIGQIQSGYPAMGFVDHVVTPVIGTGWMVAEDLVDKYVIKRIEDRVTNNYVRILVRGWLNPSRSLSNVLRGKHPWYRDTRAGVWNYTPSVDPVKSTTEPPSDGMSKWQFTIPVETIRFEDRTCVGGEANVTYRLTPAWELMFEVGGCKVLGLERNVSGDSLTYMMGPRYSSRPFGRWIPRSHFLVGGHKISEERVIPEVRDQLLKSSAQPDHRTLRPQYTQLHQANALAMSFGVGMDLGLSRSIALRLANFEYMRSWVPNPSLQAYERGLKLTTGVVFRLGEESR